MSAYESTSLLLGIKVDYDLADRLLNQARYLWQDYKVQWKRPEVLTCCFMRIFNATALSVRDRNEIIEICDQYVPAIPEFNLSFGHFTVVGKGKIRLESYPCPGENGFREIEQQCRLKLLQLGAISFEDSVPYITVGRRFGRSDDSPLFPERLQENKELPVKFVSLMLTDESSRNTIYSVSLMKEVAKKSA